MRIFVSLLVSLFFANAAWAQNSHGEIEYNPFGVPEQVVKVIVPNKLAIEEQTGEIMPIKDLRYIKSYRDEL